MDLLLVLGGGLLLYLGGDLLVSGSVRLAGRLGVRPLVVGLTVVAFGTSSPELAASIVAALGEAPDIVLGNVVGSNILNIGLILGLTAMIYPLRTRLAVIRRELPVMIAVCLLPLLLLLDGVISRTEGLVLVGILALYLVVLLRQSRVPWGDEEFTREYSREEGPLFKPLLGAVLGIGLLVAGANALVEGGVGVARALGVSERVIGLTLVALGTSLPELASSLVAAYRRHTEIVLGNLVGSSIFNILAILGVTAIVHPVASHTPEVTADILAMTAFGVLALVLLTTGKMLERWEGGVLVAAYVLYLGVLVV